MMDPLLDPEDRDLEEGLLRAGRNVGMSPQNRDRVLLTLGVTGVAVGAAGAAKAAGLSAKAAGLSVKAMLGAGAGVTALVVLSALALRSGDENQDSDPNESVQAPLVESTAPSSAPHVPQEQAQTEQPAAFEATSTRDEEEVVQDEAGSPQEVRKASASRAHGETPSASALRDELSHIARVEAALKNGQAQKALTLLSEYRSRFPRPRLGLEAEVLTIQALYESGEAVSARARAQAFLQRYPKSPLGARARKYLK